MFVYWYPIYKFLKYINQYTYKIHVNQIEGQESIIFPILWKINSRSKEGFVQEDKHQHHPWHKHQDLLHNIHYRSVCNEGGTLETYRHRKCSLGHISPWKSLPLKLKIEYGEQIHFWKNKITYTCWRKRFSSGIITWWFSNVIAKNIAIVWIRIGVSTTMNAISVKVDAVH